MIELTLEQRGKLAKLIGWYLNQDGCWGSPEDCFEPYGPPAFDTDAEAVGLLVAWETMPIADPLRGFKLYKFPRSETPTHTCELLYRWADDAPILSHSGATQATMRDAIIGAFLELIESEQ